MGNIQENFFSADWITKKVTYISSICLKIYGYPPIEFLADYKFWFKVIHPDDKERIAKSNRELTNGKKATREYRIIHADGSIRWVSNTIVPTLNEAGEVIRVDGYTSDITERKEAQLKIEELNMLISRASHDLRGPLNSAKNYIFIAKENIVDTETLSYLEKINHAYNTMEQQILSLLSLQRIHCSVTKLEKIDLQTLVAEIINSIKHISGFDKVKIFTDIKAPEELYFDRLYLHSIIYNLLNNAITYRRDIPEAFVNIRAHYDNNILVINISDNGVGMSKPNGNIKASGSGLGLYIVNNIIEKLNGNISVESEYMKGTTFNIMLPMNLEI